MHIYTVILCFCSEQVWEVSVPAGAWSSRFLVGMGEAGETVLCHTLKPNVSADFSRRGGGAFSMQWMDELGYKAPSWRIYVHDRNEQLILVREATLFYYSH